MGNYQACMYVVEDPPAPLVTVIVDEHSGEHGRVLRLREADTRAAELMLDYPNRYVCDSTDVLRNKKILPLPADHELEPSRLYIMVPGAKLHRRLSSPEVDHFSSLFRKYSPPGPRRSRARKVSPLRPEFFFRASGKCEKGSEIWSAVNYDNDYDENDRMRWETLLPPSSISSSSSFISSSTLDGCKEGNAMPPLVGRSKSWIPKLETINESTLLKC